MPRMMAGDPAATSLLMGAGGATLAAGVLASLTLFASLAILTIAFAVAGGDRAWAQEDDDDAPADSAAADSAAADSLQQLDEGEEDDDTAGPNRNRSAGFHPSYDVRFEVLKDVRTWNHVLNADYAIGDKVRLGNTWTLRAKDEQTLKRTVQTRTSTNSIEYLFSESKSVGVRYTTNWNLDNNNAQAVAIENKTTTSDVGGFTRLEHRYSDAVQVSANLSAGVRQNEYAKFSDEGTQFDADLGLKSTWSKALRSDLAWSGSRSASNTLSLQDSVPQESENLDRTSQFRGELNFNPRESLTMRLAALGARGQYQYPHAESTNVTETRTEDRANFDFGAKYRANGRLSFGLDASHSDIDKDYNLGANATDSLLAGTRRRTNGQIRTDLRAAVTYQGWKGGKTSVVLGRDHAYEQYPHQPNQEKSVEHGSATLNHEQRFSKKFISDVSAKIDLISYLFFRNGLPDSVPLYDRDLLASSIEWKGDYIVSDRFSTRFVLGVKDDQTINIESSQAAENNSKQSLWARPSVQIRPLPPLLLSQVYELRLDYTFFDDTTRVNFLTRKAQLDTRLKYQVTPRIDFDLTHLYQVRDEGSYDEGFDKNQQRSKQSLDLAAGFSPTQGVHLACGQRIEVNRAYEFNEDGDKVLRPGPSSDTQRLELFLEGSVVREVTQRLHLEARARRTLADGTTVSEREKKFYRIEAAMRYTL
jgi:hypothetical protein